MYNLRSVRCDGCSTLSDLTPPPSLTTSVTSLDCSRCDGVADLSPLSALVGLRALDCSNCRGLTDLSPLTRLTGLTSLVCGDCGLVDLSFSTPPPASPVNDAPGRITKHPMPSKSAEKLPGLILGFIRALRTAGRGSAASKLQVPPLLPSSILPSATPQSEQGTLSLSLAKLCLSNCSRLVDLSPLAGLTSLSDLNISGCRGVVNLAPLGGMSGLTKLYLNNCMGEICI